MTPSQYFAQAEKIKTALYKFQTAPKGAEKDSAKSEYLAMDQLVAPEHDEEMVALALAGDKAAMALCHMSHD